MFGGKLRLVLMGVGAALYSMTAPGDPLGVEVPSSQAMGVLEDMAFVGEMVSLDDRVSLEELETARGRQDLRLDIDEIQVSAQHNQGEQFSQLSDNVLHSAITGGNFIQNDALNGVNGIATVIQNTGNQVIIQDTTMVNIMIRP